jgi:hypothetical protein
MWRSSVLVRAILENRMARVGREVKSGWSELGASDNSLNRTSYSEVLGYGLGDTCL